MVIDYRYHLERLIMAEKYRKIICPNGHYSEAIKENNPLPRRCIVCRQQYLRTSKPIWCNANGEALEEGTQDYSVDEKKKDDDMAGAFERRVASDFDFGGEGSIRRRRKTSFFDNCETLGDVLVTEDREKEIDNKAEKMIVQPPMYFLISGDYFIELSGEGILGRDNIGRECMAVNNLVSRSHCYFIVTKQKGLEVRDAGSLNGTFVDCGNGRVAVGEKNSVYLKSGDRLWLADMLFEVKEAL